MSIGQIHYGCSFKIESAENCFAWSDLLKEIRIWIANRIDTDNNFYKGWFFGGGDWEPSSSKGVFIKTVAIENNFPGKLQKAWALNYEHPCKEYKCRKWHTEIVVEQITTGIFTFKLKTYFSLKSGHFGLEPPKPKPSAPSIISQLIKSPKWICKAGGTTLLIKSQSLKIGDGQKFHDLLESNERECPVILISRLNSSCKPLIDAQVLATRLRGTAIVYETESREVEEELRFVLGRRFTCYNGMVRVYYPDLSFSRPNDFKRHRFLWPQQIEEWGEDKTLQSLINCIARRPLYKSKGIQTVNDIYSLKRKQRIIELKTSLSENSTQEWAKLLEEENTNLAQQLEAFELERIDLQIKLSDSEELLDRLKSDKLRLNKEKMNVESDLRSMSTKYKAITSLHELPTNLSQVVDCIRKLHPDRIVFTEQAIKSIKECKYNKIPNAWRVLYQMCTTLYELFFYEDINNIEQEFRNRTGIELAMKEGKSTKHNSKLMNTRKDVYQNSDIDITPHIKFDDNTTRAYFCPYSDGQEQKIIVGYLGHLNTAGTRRRKD